MNYKYTIGLLCLLLQPAPLLAAILALPDKQTFAFINQPQNWKEIAAEQDVAAQIRSIRNQLTFFAGLARNNATLKSYQLQQEKLATLNEQLSQLLLQQDKTNDAIQALQQAFQQYRNIVGVSTDVQRWQWKQLGILNQISHIQESSDLTQAALTTRSQIDGIYRELLGDHEANYILYSEIANHEFATARLLIRNQNFDKAQQRLNRAQEIYHQLNLEELPRTAQYSTGRWNFRLLEIQVQLAAIQTLQDPQQGLTSYQLAKEQVRSMLIDDPQKPELLALLAEDIHIPLASIFLEQENIHAALTERQQADEIFEILSVLVVDIDNVRINQAANLVQMAEFQKSLHQPYHALANYQAATEHYQQLMNKQPAEKRWQHFKSITLSAIGDLHSQQGEHDQAVRYQQQAITLANKLFKGDPDSAPWAQSLWVAHWRSARSAQAQQNYSEAIRHNTLALQPAEAAWQANPDDVEQHAVVADLHSDLGNLYNNLEESSEHQVAALQHYHQALWHYLLIKDATTEPDQHNQRLLQISDHFQHIASIYMQQGHYEAMVAVTEAAQQILSDTEGAGDENNADWLSRIAFSSARKARALAILEDNQLSLNNYEVAEVYYEQLVKLQPDNPEWSELLVTSLLLEAKLREKLGEPHAAIFLGQRALQFSQPLHQAAPGNTHYTRSVLEAYQLLGDNHTQLFERHAAINAYQNAFLINIKLRHEERDEQWLIDQHHLTDRLAQHYRSTGRMAAALENFENLYHEINKNQAIQHVPNWQGTLILFKLTLGEINLNQGRTQQAGKLFEEARNMLSNVPAGSRTEQEVLAIITITYQRSVARLHLVQGNILAAEQAYQKVTNLIAKQLDNGNNITWQTEHVTNLLDAGDLLQLKDQPQQAKQIFLQAEPILQRFLEETPDSVDYSFYLALVYERVGQIDLQNDRLKTAQDTWLAEQQLYQAMLKQDPHNSHWKQGLAENYRRLALLYQRQGDNYQALLHHEKAQKIIETLLQHNASYIYWRSNQVKNHIELGKYWSARDNDIAAINHLQQAINLSETMIQEHDDIVEWQTDLASSYLELAKLIQPEDQKQVLLKKAFSALQKLEENGQLFPKHHQTMHEVIRAQQQYHLTQGNSNEKHTSHDTGFLFLP